jgi:hypothetical protein
MTRVPGARWREAAVVAGLAIAAVIHAVPAYGLLGGAALERLYGLDLHAPGLLLLMQHRALLFGLLASALLGAIFLRAWRTPVLLAGLASAAGFLLLAPANLSPALQRVYTGDVIAVAGLLLALVARLTPPRPRS